MLSRIADAMFWIGRYIERADQTARILDVNVQAINQDSGDAVEERCREVYGIFGMPAPQDGSIGLQRLLDSLAVDRGSPSSVAGSLQAARENARGAREVLSTEVWESLNATTLGMPTALASSRMHGFFQWAKDRCAVVNGLVDASMTRDEAWQFWQLGRIIERIDMVARILQAHDLEDTSDAATVVLLRTCSAHEAYIRSYRGQVDSSDAIRFLLQDSFFPRSIVHCLEQLDRALDTLAKMHGHAFDRIGTEDPARRIAGRALASLHYRTLEDIIGDFDEEMEQVQVITHALTRSISGSYFRPIA